MNTLKNKAETNEEYRFPYMTDHFVERYFERIMDEPKPKQFSKDIYNGVKKDMKNRMLDREMMTMELFGETIVLPLSRY